MGYLMDGKKEKVRRGQKNRSQAQIPSVRFTGWNVHLKILLLRKLSIVFLELLSDPSDLKYSYKNKEGNHIHNHNLSNHHGRAHYQTFLCSS